MSDATETQKQELYRTARTTGEYDKIWQSVGKCAFCDLRDKYVFYEENGMVMTVALFAYIDGHFMIIPRRHVTTTKELTVAEWHTVQKMLYIAKKIIKDVHGIKGMQLVQKDGAEAQSTVGHIHFHCVPFDSSDLNVWNYRTLANTPLRNAQLYKQAYKKIVRAADRFDQKYANQANSTSNVETDTSVPYVFDWSDIAFGSKKEINALHAVFIAAPRDMSPARFTQLVKTYLPQGHIVLGIAKEPYVEHLEEQPQFSMLAVKTVQDIITKINTLSKHKLFTLTYFQRELPFILEKLHFKRIILVNGSWYRSFHTLPAYYALAKRQLIYDMVSPFADEAEAQAYALRATAEAEARSPAPTTAKLSEADLMRAAADAAKLSFDYTFQTGAVLAKKTKGGYRFLLRAYNAVVPYQTFAMHHGSVREREFSPPGDLNHYDTNHAEVNILLAAHKQGIDLQGTTLFINLLPCPTCCRMLCQTGIAEVVYRLDHSDGYALQLLPQAGKTVRRFV